ncbi:MAG: hypothetical protein LAT68_00655 [Cyclobacteriaceae bacterium]|nr:hypothetical protein [Cyclobacteriaceae bacterium]MCH8514813.1 hypothetical protein [Cyclobacteriaceae bacterium]
MTSFKKKVLVISLFSLVLIFTNILFIYSQTYEASQLRYGLQGTDLYFYSDLNQNYRVNSVTSEEDGKDYLFLLSHENLVLDSIEIKGIFIDFHKLSQNEYLLNESSHYRSLKINKGKFQIFSTSFELPKVKQTETYLIKLGDQILVEKSALMKYLYSFSYHIIDENDSKFSKRKSTTIFDSKDLPQKTSYFPWNGNEIYSRKIMVHKGTVYGFSTFFNVFWSYDPTNKDVIFYEVPEVDENSCHIAFYDFSKECFYLTRYQKEEEHPELYVWNPKVHAEPNFELKRTLLIGRKSTTNLNNDRIYFFDREDGETSSSMYYVDINRLDH